MGEGLVVVVSEGDHGGENGGLKAAKASGAAMQALREIGTVPVRKPP
jgi:hypothetical protein